MLWIHGMEILSCANPTSIIIRAGDQLGILLYVELIPSKSRPILTPYAWKYVGVFLESFLIFPLVDHPESTNAVTR